MISSETTIEIFFFPDTTAFHSGLIDSSIDWSIRLPRWSTSRKLCRDRKGKRGRETEAPRTRVVHVVLVNERIIRCTVLG